MGVVDVDLNNAGFAISVAIFGAGAGLMLSQLGNVITSAAPPEDINEAGGLQGTFQNLGASLGTALIGAVLIAALSSGFLDRIAENPDVSQRTRDQVEQTVQKGIPIVPVSDVQQAAEDAGASRNEAEALANDYGDAQLQALKRAIGAVAIFALLGLWFTRGLPGRGPPEAEAER